MDGYMQSDLTAQGAVASAEDEVQYPVESANPPAPWRGGKKNLAKRLCAIIDAVPHACYAEAFVGAGGVFFRRQSAVKCEIVNDINLDIINLFRVCREDMAGLIKELEWQITHRDEYERLKALDPASLTAVQRAARFQYLQRLSFGGHVGDKQTFGTSTEVPGRFNAEREIENIRAMHSRLKKVHFDCLDWREFIQRYDYPHVLFYLDPPYFGNENDYGKNVFARKDFAEMAEALSNISGKFIYSINAAPEIRECFAAFQQKEVDVTYTSDRNASPKFKELIITNFDLPNTEAESTLELGL